MGEMINAGEDEDPGCHESNEKVDLPCKSIEKWRNKGWEDGSNRRSWEEKEHRERGNVSREEKNVGKERQCVRK